VSHVADLNINKEIVGFNSIFRFEQEVELITLSVVLSAPFICIDFPPENS
jgi:hypothetical protein